MQSEDLRKLLEQVASGAVGVEAAHAALSRLPFEDIGIATIDHHRALRCGFPEVIFGHGKSDAQIEEIFVRLAAAGGPVLATRVAPSAAERVRRRVPDAVYHELPRALVRQPAAPPEPVGLIGIVCAGTADLPVAEEARITAELMGQRTRKLYDVGVAGLHRLLGQAELLRAARVLVVVAGMEGALPSVVGGLVKCPVIAVPTSVGYGAHLGGIAALLAMLNSCAAGITVVNIDNGFGAGVSAARINQLGEPEPAK